MDAAVFLDRDNTLIHNDGYDLGDADAVRLLQGAASAIASLRGLGFKVVVVTNQGGVARGKYTEEDVRAVHRRIVELIEQGANTAQIDAFYFCPFHPEGKLKKFRRDHPNRKPRPGMLYEAARDLKLDLANCWTVGDKVRDVQAGTAAGTRTILLRPDADRLRPLEPDQMPQAQDDASDVPADTTTPDFFARSIVEAVRIIAQKRTREGPSLGSGPTSAKQPPIAAPTTREPKIESNRDGRTVEPDDPDNPPAGRSWERNGIARLRESRHSVAARPADADKPPRPFKPWNSPTEQPSSVGMPIVARGPNVALGAPEPAAADSTGADPTVADAAPADRADRVIGPSATKADAAPDRTADQRAGAGSDEASGPAGSMDRTLRQILQELRGQRGTSGEFSYLTVFAIVLQTVAAVCLLGGLWMGATDSDLFIRWMFCGLLLQGATIAVLLFSRDWPV